MKESGDPTYPAVVPMIAYEDAGAAADWLCLAFGFRERSEQRYTDDDGTVGHAELETGDGGVVMLATPSKDYRSPKNLRKLSADVDRALSVPWVVDGVLVHIRDLDTHLAHARAAGATILGEEEAQYGRLYRAEDLEGHRWMFMQRPPALG